MGLGLWILHRAGSLARPVLILLAHPPCSLMYPEPASPWPLVFCPAGSLCHPPWGMLCMCRLVPVPSSLAIPCLSPQILPSFLSSSQLQLGPLSPGFRHRAREQFLPACLPRKNLITTPLSLWGSGGSTATSLGATPVAATLSQCHTQGAGSKL